MKRLDPDVRALAERMMERRGEAGERVKRGEIMHLRFMEPDSLLERASKNLEQLDVPTNDPVAPGRDMLSSLADCGNYGLALIAAGKVVEG